MPITPDWIGKIRGHVSEAKAHFKQDERSRKAAEKAPNSIIFNRNEIYRGEWNPSKILNTTLGGFYRPITMDDLRVFQQNMIRFRKEVGQDVFERSYSGVTARQVIDISAKSPLNYKDQSAGYRNDLDKAKRQITMAMPVSAMGDTIRFLTNSGGESNPKVSRHTVIIKLLDYQNAVSHLVTTDKNKTKTPQQLANMIRKGRVKFDCDCDRHRYFFRFLATIGGFNAGRPEEGFPKIRNPNLKGIACKHVIRVMTELESSNTTLRFLTKHLEKAHSRAMTSAKQRDVEAQLKSKNPSKIKTSDQRKAEAEARKAQRALKRGLQKTKLTKPKTAKKTIRQPTAKFTDWRKGLTPQQISAIKKTASLFGISPEEMAKRIKS